MLVITLIAFALVGFVVFIHYEILLNITKFISKAPGSSRFKIYFVIIGALIGHIIEIWVFAIAYYILSFDKNYGEIQGMFVETYDIINYVYYSSVTYTSLGYGDMVPIGNIRFITAAETITGLVLIAWTASFAYFHMQKLWQSKNINQ